MAESPAPQAGDLFFAYGTLRPGGRMFARLRLAGALAYVGPGAVRGALVALGAYPGLIEGRRGLARGAVFRVRDPGVFRRLDDYEGFDPAAPEGSLFVRTRLKLAGRRGQAWVYVWNGAARGRAVRCGVWRG